MLSKIIDYLMDIIVESKRASAKRRVSRFFDSTGFSSVSDEKELGYQDPFVTHEQMKRDAEITKLLEAYVKAYQSKVCHGTICRYVLLIPCVSIIIALSAVLGYSAVRIFTGEGDLEIEDLIAFVTACVSFVSLIIGLLTIMTKYFFPENDEQYITKIVEAIQKNDLSNKIENAKYRDQVSGEGSSKQSV